MTNACMLLHNNSVQAFLRCAVLRVFFTFILPGGSGLRVAFYRGSKYNSIS